MAAVWGIVFVFLEAYNGWDFVIAPLLRFLANWPSRIGNWFTDPSRAGVPLEIVFVALVAWWAYRKVDHYRPERAAVTAGTS